VPMRALLPLAVEYGFMITLRLIGSVDLARADGTGAGSVLAQPKRLALLAYLILARPRGFHRRDKILALFWPELDQERARHALRQSLYFLRKSLGDDVLVTRSDEEVGIEWGRVSVDVLELEQALASGDVPRAVDLYAGELMDGFFASASPDFDHWLDGERSRLREELWVAVSAATTVAEADDDLPLAVDLAATASRLRPLHEPSARIYIGLLGRTGDRAAALEAFERLRQALEADFGIEPASETLELVAAIREADAPGDGTGSSTQRATAVPAESRADIGLRERREVPAVSRPALVWTLAAVTAIGLLSARNGRGLIDGSAEVGDGTTTGMADVASNPTVVGRGPVRIHLMPPESTSDDPEWAFLADRLHDEMRRAIGQHAPGVELLESPGLATASTGSAHRERYAGGEVPGTASGYVIGSRYTTNPHGMALTVEVSRLSTGERIRVLEPVRASPDSLEAFVRKAGQRTAVAAMALEAPLGDLDLQFLSLPESPAVLGLVLSGREAFRTNRYKDAVEWLGRAIELEPQFPGAYVWLRWGLGPLDRLSEWEALDSAYRVVVPSMTRFETLFMKVAEATGPTDRIAAVEEQFRLTDGRAMAFDLAFNAVQGNRIALAREALERQDFEDPYFRDFRPLWTLDAFVKHLSGDYAKELERARDGLARFTGRMDRAGDHPIGQAGQEVRALVGLDSIDAAVRAYDRLEIWPVPPGTLWLVMSQAALEFRRHGHMAASDHAFDVLLQFVDRHPGLDPAVVAATYYEAGRFASAIPLLRGQVDSAEGLERLMPAAMLIISLEALGRTTEASEYEWILSDVDSMSSDPRRTWVAAVAASRGDASGAVRELLSAYRAGAWYYHSGRGDGAFMPLRPEFEPIRGDAAFRRLLEPR